MKKTFLELAVIIFSALLITVTAACSPAAPAPAIPTNPPAAQTTGKATQPTPVPTQPTATVLSTQPSAPTQQATAAATRPLATPTQSAVKPGLEGIPAAFAKTKAATSFKVSEKLSGNGSIIQFSPGMPASAVLVGADGEFNGNDSHVILSGLAGSLFSDDPTKGIEVTKVGGKTYIHGPASALNAPTNNWYLLDANSGFTMTFSVPQNLDSLAAANGDWSQFQKSRSDSLDGKKCDVYTGGKEPAGIIIGTVSKPMLSSLITDNGSAELWVCDDGYLHAINASVQAHDQSTPPKTGKIDMSFHIFEQGSNLAISAPANPLASKSTNNAAPTSAPLPTKSAGGAGQSTATSTDGEWQGNTSSDSPISFEVSNNQITYLNLGYYVQSGSCSLSGSYGNTPNNAQIKGNAINIQLTDSDGMQFIFAGTFTSNTEAKGTLEVKGSTSNCGAVDAKSTWTAQNSPSNTQPTPDNSATTTAPSGGTSSMDATDVVLGFFAAINAKDLDTAMSLVQDDVIVKAGSTTIMGADDLKTYLQKQTSHNITYTAKNLDSTGDIVNFSLQTSDQASVVNGDSAIVQDGQIQILTLH